VRAGTSPAQQLDMVEGRSKQAFKTWLAERPRSWREQVEVVAMDGFTGFKTAADVIPPRIHRTDADIALIPSVATSRKYTAQSQFETHVSAGSAIASCEPGC
jgi:hypothetical protein